MTDRAQQLHTTADRQIAGLSDLVSTLDQDALGLPCPGREKLGDGTVAASAQHTADNNQRIATFVQTSDRMTSRHAPPNRGGHRTPRFLQALGHRPPDHAGHDRGAGSHGDHNTTDSIRLDAVLEQLSGTRDALRQIAELTDNQLDAIPGTAASASATDNGQRTLEQVLASLLKHQAHQLHALTAATA